MADVYGMDVLKAMKKFGVIGIVFCVMQTDLLGATQFTLPKGIQGAVREVPSHLSFFNPFLLHF